LAKALTPAIIQSLAPGVAGCLKVKANGIVMDGNTRAKVLEERGYPLESLPFEPYPRTLETFMNVKSLVLIFSALRADQQVKHLAEWAHAVTIDARDTYIPGVEGIADPVRLRRFNELQHRLLGQLIAVLHQQSSSEYESFLAMVVENAKELHAVALKEKLNAMKSETLSLPPRRRVG
jgi:hypothetical protein